MYEMVIGVDANSAYIKILSKVCDLLKADPPYSDVRSHALLVRTVLRTTDLGIVLRRPVCR